MPATHNTPHMDACGEAGDRTINPPPRLDHLPTQPVDVTSSAKLNNAEDVDLPERRRGQHYSSSEEGIGFDDCSGYSNSDGRESPKTNEELSTRKHHVKLSTRKLPVKEPSGRSRQEGSSHEEKPSLRSLKQTLEEERQTLYKQAHLPPLQFKLACLPSRQAQQTHLPHAYFKLAGLQ
jgi:hypothetical protein